MKKNVRHASTLTVLISAISQAINNLFFTEDRDFQRLKNFIAS